MIRRTVLWMLVFLLVVSWPLSLWIVPAFGGPQPNWLWKSEPATVLVEFDTAHAILLFPGELVYIYSRTANWSFAQTVPTTVNGFAQHFDLWPLTLIGVILGAYVGLFPDLRRSKRRAKNLCTECAYHLRGSQQRCPECGTEFESEQTPLNPSRGFRLLSLTRQYSTTFLIVCMILVAILAGVIGNLVRYLKS